jgi:hypothetical protein
VPAIRESLVSESLESLELVAARLVVSGWAAPESAMRESAGSLELVAAESVESERVVLRWVAPQSTEL